VYTCFRGSVSAVGQIHLHRAPHPVNRRDAGHEVRILGIAEECLGSDLRANVVAGRHHVRTGDGAFLDQLVEADVDVERDARAPDRRHARFEGAAEGGLIGGVRVRVDQPGQDVLSAQVERTDAGGRRPRSNRLDPSAAHHDCRVRRDAAVPDVHDVAVDERERRVGRSLGSLRERGDHGRKNGSRDKPKLRHVPPSGADYMRPVKSEIVRWLAYLPAHPRVRPVP
jgi:hypothetical protein